MKIDEATKVIELFIEKELEHQQQNTYTDEQINILDEKLESASINLVWKWYGTGNREMQDCFIKAIYWYKEQIQSLKQPKKN
jgi:hypothetical protein